MARTVFLLLLLLNLIALAWVYLKGDERLNAGREPLRVKAELAADKIRLLPPADTAPQALSAVQASLSSVPAVVEACSAYTGATVAEAEEIAKAWSAKLPAARITANPVQPPPIFDVLIPGLASRAVAETKLGELKKLGIGAGVQIKDGDDKRFSLLIASFAERNAADEALKDASKKGVRSAVVVARQPAAERAVIEIRGSDAVLKPLAGLAALRKNLSPTVCIDARGAP